MATKYYQNGRLQTAVAVSLVKSEIKDSWGSWSISPSETVKANTRLDRIFQTVNRQSYMCGPKGQVCYEAADGSLFTIDFDCPTSAPNICNVSVGQASPWKIVGSVPPDGIDDINYDCTITQKKYDEIIDVPVLVKDIIDAPKCDMLSAEEILGLASERDRVRLQDVFMIGSLPAEAKLWCARSPLFLTAQGKAALSRSFVQKIIGEQHEKATARSSLLEAALIWNDNMAQGEYSASKIESLHADFAKELAGNSKSRGNELLCMVQSLLNPDFQAGWTSVVNLYVKRNMTEGLRERQQKVIDFIQRNL